MVYIKRGGKGFTLIELLVVVLIIGILAAIALPRYNDAVEKARASEAIITIRSIRDAQKMYHLLNGSYSADFSKLDYNFFDKDGVQITASTMTSKNFVYALHDMAGSIPHAQALRSAGSNWYIVSYFQWPQQQISCVTANANTIGNSFCSKLSSTSATCPESGYKCYQIPD